MPEEIFVVDSAQNARRHRGRHRQHLMFGAILIGTAISGVAGAHHGSILLPALMVASGLAVILTTVVAHRRSHHGTGDRWVAWTELAGVVMAFVETFEKIRGPHHAGFVALSFAAPLLMSYIAWHAATGRPSSYMKATDEGLEVRRRLLRPRRRVQWGELAAVRIDGDAMQLVGNGTVLHSIDLSDVRNRSEAIEWVSEQFGRRGLPVDRSGGAAK